MNLGLADGDCARVPALAPVPLPTGGQERTAHDQFARDLPELTQVESQRALVDPVVLAIVEVGEVRAAEPNG